jgi:putative oxidoreductase
MIKKLNWQLESLLDKPSINKLFRGAFFGTILVVVISLVLHWSNTLANAQSKDIQLPGITVPLALLVVCISGLLIFTDALPPVGPALLMAFLLVAAPTLVPFWDASGVDLLIWPHVFQTAVMLFGLAAMLIPDWRANIVGRIALCAMIAWITILNLTSGLPAAIQYATFMSVPLPGILVPVAQGMLAISGVLILLGVYPRIGLLLYMAFLLAVTPLMHPFWSVPSEAVFFGTNMMLFSLAGIQLKKAKSWPYVLKIRSAGVQPASAS